MSIQKSCCKLRIKMSFDNVLSASKRLSTLKVVLNRVGIIVIAYWAPGPLVSLCHTLCRADIWCDLKMTDNVWENQLPGVNLVKTSLTLPLQLPDGESLEQYLHKVKGNYSKELGGWFVDYRSIKCSYPSGLSGRWMEIEGEFAVFKPFPGIKMGWGFITICNLQVSRYRAPSSRWKMDRHFVQWG